MNRQSDFAQAKICSPHPPRISWLRAGGRFHQVQKRGIQFEGLFHKMRPVFTDHEM
jgi:hypothetical protein